MSHIKEIFKDKRNRLTVLIIVCLVVLAVFLIFRFSVNAASRNALDAIPADAAVIIEVRQLSELHEELSTNSGVWSELMNFDFFSGINSDILFLDSLLLGSDCAQGLLKDHPVYISFHVLKSGNAGVLYLTSLPGKCSESEAESMVEESAGENAVIAEVDYNDESFTEVMCSMDSVKFYYVISQGVFIGGYQPDLIANALKQQKSDGHLSLNKSFAKVQSTAGKKVQANVYVNNAFFPGLFALLAGKETAADISELSGFSGWSALDVSIKKDAFLLNGFAMADTNGFLNTFSGQSPQAVTITEAIPSSAAAFLSYGFSDFSKWYESYKTYLKKKGTLAAYSAKVAEMNKNNDADIEKEITSWIGNEMALVMTEPSDTGFSENLFLVIKTDNVENVSKLLSEHSQAAEKKAEKPKKVTKTKKSKSKKTKKDKSSETADETKATEKTEVKDNVIYEYKIPGVFPVLFGKVFDGIQGTYYAIEDNYVIFGNTLSGLKKYIKDYAAEKNLDNSNSYLAFSKNVSAESNIYLYCNIRKSLGIFMKHANEDLSEYIGGNLSLFRNFDAFAYQVKTSGDMFYNNVCLKTNTVVISENDALWSVELDSVIFGKPVIVHDTVGKPASILVFDNACNMYKIGAEGAIKWKLKLKEKPLGSVETIDYDKNGSCQYLFNTESYLYLIDNSGEIHEKFPVSLTESATAPLTLADYAKTKDYRIIIPIGKKIYNFQKDGSQTSGWTVVKTNADIIANIVHLKLNGTDIYTVADKSGTLYIFDRKGKEYIELKEQPLVSPFSKFYVTSSGKIITTDIKGNILFISSGGKIEKEAVSGLSAQHYFLYADINKDKKYEYIFVDKSKLSIYGQDYKLISSFTFPADITTTPEIFEDIGDNNFLGILCLKTKKVYVIDEECSVREGYPMSATSMFALGSFNTDDSYNLIVGDGNKLYNYSFE